MTWVMMCLKILVCSFSYTRAKIEANSRLFCIELEFRIVNLFNGYILRSDEMARYSVADPLCCVVDKALIELEILSLWLSSGRRSTGVIGWGYK